MSGLRKVVLQRGREHPIRAGHPWIFSRAIASGLEGAEPGEPVHVHTSSGQFLAVGYCNPRTAIAVRVVSLEDEALDVHLIGRRVDEALALRRATLPTGLTAYRVLNGEGDRLPGVVVDRYGDQLVCQLLTAGAERISGPLVEALQSRLGPRGIYERSEGGVRAEEGVPGTRGVLAGDEPSPPLVIEEAGARFLVDVVHGQKTGFFLDQRDARALVGRLAAGRRVLNAFAYTGAFSIVAARAGAERVVSVESSRPALTLAEAAWAENALAPEVGELVPADVFEFLRATRERFDLVVVDPPPFVRRRRDLQPGLRGYRDLNLQALRRLEPGGWLFTSSCSQHLGAAAFREVVMGAAAAAGHPAQVVAETGHPADHPVALAHPEGAYLKGLLLRA